MSTWMHSVLVVLDRTTTRQMINEWCDQHFGPRNEVWESIMPYFYFNDEKHKVLFLLKWGGK